MAANPYESPASKNSDSPKSIKKSDKTLKGALVVLGILIFADPVYFSYFWIIHSDYYFPGAYEEAFGAAINAFVVGVPLIIAFVWTWLAKRKRCG